MADQLIGDVASKVLFENDRVRIWETRLAPGERSVVHHHDLDYVLVQVDGDRLKGVFEAETAGVYIGEVEADVVPGNFIFISKGGAEAAENSGARPYCEVLIELKD